MKLKDAARYIGRLGLLFPLLLIFIVADSAFACPGHKNGAAYRTKSVKTRTVSGIPTTVISYRGPASTRCANVATTRTARYVAVRNNGSARYVPVRRSSGVRYVAVRNNGVVYRPKQTRYVAVRNAEIDVEPRYVAVRRQPVYTNSGTRYVAVRRAAPQVRYVAVRNVETPRYVAVRNVEVDTPRYAAVRSTPAYNTRYVAVRQSPVYDSGSRYVAVRNVDSDLDTIGARYVAVNDEFEAASPRHVVVRTDHLTGTQDVIVPQRSVSPEYVAFPSDNMRSANYVQYSDASYYDDGYMMASEADTPCLRQVAVRTCRETVSPATVSYTTVSDFDDFEDEAILDTAGTTYIAADDLENACLRTVGYNGSPAMMETVSYVPADDFDDTAVINDSAPRYVLAGNYAPHSIPYVALDDDGGFNDVKPEFVASGGLERARMGTAEYAVVDDIDDIDTETVSYVPVSDTEYRTVSYNTIDDIEDLDTETVSYVPVDEIDDIEYVDVDIDEIDDSEFRTVNYMPVEDTHVSTVSYVPVDGVETAYIAAEACPMTVSSVNAEPVYIADSSTVLVEEVDDDVVAVPSGTHRIAKQFGYHEGFEKGLEDALDNDDFEPTDAGDYRKATDGYEDEFGDKELYRGVFRNSFIEGYRAGFASVTGNV